MTIHQSLSKELRKEFSLAEDFGSIRRTCESCGAYINYSDAKKFLDHAVDLTLERVKREIPEETETPWNVPFEEGFNFAIKIMKDKLGKGEEE